MSQESSISRMQELEIEKEKVYSRMDFWNSWWSWAFFQFISVLICCEASLSYLLRFLYFSLLDGWNVGAATNSTGKQQWQQQCCFSWLQWSANIQKKEISFCALSVIVFPFQSEQEEKINRLRNMICSAGREDSSKPDKEKMAKVCSFLHSSFVVLLRELLAGDVSQAPVIQWLHSINPLDSDLSGE